MFKSLRLLKNFIVWQKDSFALPAPPNIKHKVLARYLNNLEIVIETGTFRGESSQVLSQICGRVITIEPDQKLYERAKLTLKEFKNVEIINQRSEAILEALVSQAKGKIGFFLDSHFCGPGTHRGPSVSPIKFELEIIGRLCKQFPKVVVLVDDLRYFDKRYYGDDLYPSLNFLIEWCKDHGFDWRVEYDILIAIREQADTAPIELNL